MVDATTAAGAEPPAADRAATAGLGESQESADAMAEAEQLWPDNPRLAGVRANLEEMNVAST